MPIVKGTKEFTRIQKNLKYQAKQELSSTYKETTWLGSENCRLQEEDGHFVYM
jgi:hypothetical protein